MKTITAVILVVFGVAFTNEPGTIEVQKMRNNLYLQTPEMIETSFGHPFQKQVFDNHGTYDWMKRMIWYYYTPDSSEVVAFVFDYVNSKKGMKKTVKKNVQLGNYHLIMVVYKPEYLHKHIVGFAGK